MLTKHTTEDNCAKMLEKKFCTVQTDLHHKHPYVLDFYHPGKNRNKLWCDLPDGRRIVLERIFNSRLKTTHWLAQIVDQKSGKLLHAGKKPLRAKGNSWSVACARVISINQFWHKKSAAWLNFYDLGKPHFLHPKHLFDFGHKTPRNCGEIPTQAMLDRIAEKNANLARSRKESAELERARKVAAAEKKRKEDGKEKRDITKAVYGWDSPYIQQPPIKVRKPRQAPLARPYRPTPTERVERLMIDYDRNPTPEKWKELDEVLNPHLRPKRKSRKNANSKAC